MDIDLPYLVLLRIECYYVALYVIMVYFLQLCGCACGHFKKCIIDTIFVVMLFMLSVNFDVVKLHSMNLCYIMLLFQRCN